MAKVWGYVKTVLSIIGGIAIAIWAMRRTGLRRADAARGVVADIRSATDGVRTGIDAATDANAPAAESIAVGRVWIADSAGVVDEIDASIGRSQTILGDVRGQG